MINVFLHALLVWSFDLMFLTSGRRFLQAEAMVLKVSYYVLLRARIEKQ